MVSAGRLLRALVRSAQAGGCVADARLLSARDWASATFTGARYDVVVTLAAGSEASEWIAALPEAELTMPRQFVSEVRVIGRDEADGRIVLTVEALVLED